MKIPKQLKNKRFRFIKVDYRKKRPIERKWPTESNYKYTDPDFKQYLEEADAFGIACGWGELAVIDLDVKEYKKHVSKIKQKLPPTFETRTGSGGIHLYYIIEDLDKKIILEKGETHFGEVQWSGAMAICPGSRYPEADPNKKFDRYEIVNNAPIAEISKETLMSAIGDFLEDTSLEKTKWQSTDPDTYDIEIIAKQIKGLVLGRERNEKCYIGPHPIHGSETGGNFHINIDKNAWYCHHHKTGGDALQLVAVLEGVIKCEDCKSGALKGDNYKKTLEIARDKYGLYSKQELAILENCQEQLGTGDILKKITEEIHKEGVVGQEQAIRALILTLSLTKVKNARPTSSNLLVSDKTGAGKDWITRKTCEVMLKPSDLYHRTSVTEKLLNYWGTNLDKNGIIDWNGKVLYIEDPSPNTLKSDAFRIRASGENRSVVLIDQVPTDLKVKGKPVIIVTSMKTGIDIEGERRWETLPLKITKEHLDRIKKRQLFETAGTDYSPDIKFREAVKNIPRVNVVIPFGPELAELTEVFNTLGNTLIPKLVDYIRASAALHQFQRERNKNGQVIATTEDYTLAKELYDTVRGDNLSGLNYREKELIRFLKNSDEEYGHTLAEIMAEVPGITRNWLYRSNNVDDLKERGYITTIYEHNPKAGRSCTHLKYAGKNGGIKLPSAERLKETIVGSAN